MGNKVLQFKLSDSSAKRMLAEIAADSAQVKFTEHALEQMRKRRITPKQVVDCLLRATVTESPVLDQHGNWKLTVERGACGARIGVAVAIHLSPPKAIVITAFMVR
jgi:hypothetical protein